MSALFSKIAKSLFSFIQKRVTKPRLPLLSLILLAPHAHADEQQLHNSEIMKEVNKLARAGALDFEKHIVPILDKYCTDCHNPDDDEGSLDLEALLTLKQAAMQPELWEMVGKTAKMDVMPPPKRKKRPTLRERALIMGWALQIGYLWDQGIMGANPGRTTLRRLNRNEYNYTIRDLFNLKIRPADNFPEDSAGEGGFDNDADALFLPALLMENYFEASVKIADLVLGNQARRQHFLLRSSNDAAGARKVFTYWAPRIYRGHVAEAEIDRLVKVYENSRKKGKQHILAIRDPLIMMLVSPRFLYRLELPIAGAGEGGLC